MKRAKQMEPEQRKRYLLEVAISAFAAKGIDSAKHSDVAKAAGVAVPTVHAYFKTRADLVLAVLEEVGRFIREECTKPYLNGGSYQQRMMSSGLGLLEHVQQQPDYFKVWIMWGANFGEPYKGLYEDYLLLQTPLLAQILTDDPASAALSKVKEKARLMEGLSMMLAQLVLRGDPQISPERFMESVSAMLAD